MLGELPLQATGSRCGIHCALSLLIQQLMGVYVAFISRLLGIGSNKVGCAGIFAVGYRVFGVYAPHIEGRGRGTGKTTG